MKTNPFLTVGALIALVSLTAGCRTGVTPTAQTQSRIQEKATAFNRLTPTQQTNILGGAIERGNTPDMVYMALGKPAKIVTSADGAKAMWVYVEYFAANAAFTTGLNNPNSTNYTPAMVAANTPWRGGDPVASPNAPGHFTGYPSFVRPAEFSGTSNAGPVQSLSLPDLNSNTVYVFFHRGKVVEIKLDGAPVDQASAQHPPENKRLRSSPTRNV